MKKGIHPEYHRCKVTCLTCGNTFETGSVLPEIRVDTCSKCHSFYTGKAGVVVSDGRVDRFQKKYAKAAAPAAQPAAEPAKPEAK